MALYLNNQGNLIKTDHHKVQQVVVMMDDKTIVFKIDENQEIILQEHLKINSQIEEIQLDVLKQQQLLRESMLLANDKGGMNLRGNRKAFNSRAQQLVNNLSQNNLIKMSSINFDGKVHSCNPCQRESGLKYGFKHEYRVLISESNHRCQLAYLEGGSLNIIIISLWH